MSSAWDSRQQAMLEAMGLRVWNAPARQEPMADPAVAQAVAEPPEPPAAPRVAVPPSPGLASAPAVATVRAAPVRMPSTEVAPATPATPVVQHPAARANVSVAGAAQIASMDWAALRTAVAGCQACTLCEGRTNTVFGVGNERAHWMIVGEAPGQHEDAQGEPFVGQAGKLLDSMLRAIGLTREEAPPQRQVFIANTLKCRPPGNRNPEPQELAQCEPYLDRQIALVQPRIILAMGRFAVQSLLRSNEAIGRLRGRVHEYQGVPLIVTYHPAYLLRNLVDKARAWEDLCLAMDTLRRKT